MPSPVLPLYVDDLGHGLQVPEIPASCDDCTLFSFFLPADHAAMQALVDRFLNAPARGAVRYRVIGAHARATFTCIGRVFDPLARDTKGVDGPVVTVRGPGVLPPFATGVFHFTELL